MSAKDADAILGGRMAQDFTGIRLTFGWLFF
jgi:hypothetical protein